MKVLFIIIGIMFFTSLNDIKKSKKYDDSIGQQTISNLEWGDDLRGIDTIDDSQAILNALEWAKDSACIYENDTPSIIKSVLFNPH